MLFNSEEAGPSLKEGCQRSSGRSLLDLTGKPRVRKTSLWDGMEEGGGSPKSEPSGTGVHCLDVLRERTNGGLSGEGGRERERLCTREEADGVPLAGWLFC